MYAFQCGQERLQSPPFTFNLFVLLKLCHILCFQSSASSSLLRFLMSTVNIMSMFTKNVKRWEFEYLMHLNEFSGDWVRCWDFSLKHLREFHKLKTILP